MYFRKYGSSQKLCIFKEGRNARETGQYFKKHQIENAVVAFIGGTASGKSVFVNHVAAKLYLDCNYTVVYITEKKGDEYNNAFCHFKPKARYHLSFLERQGKQSITLPVKLYHHFTFNIPYRKSMPPIRLFTSSVKELNEIKLSAIFPGDSESAIEICQDIAENLEDDEDIYDYTWKVYNSTLDDNPVMKNKMTDLYLPYEKLGGSIVLRSIRQGLKMFNKEDFYLHPHNSPYKLDFSDMLNDNKHLHYLSTKWLKSRKSKLLSIIYFLTGIEEALDSGKINKNVCLIFEELKILVGAGSSSKQESILLDILYKLFSRIRTKAMVLATMQSYFDLPKKFRGLFNKIFLGKLNYTDLMDFIDDANFRKIDEEKFYRLRTGDFVIWESRSQNEKVSDIFHVWLPPFANAEQGEDYFTRFVKEYPKKLTNYVQIYNRMKKIKSEAERKAKKRTESFIRERKKREEQKKDKKSKEVDDLKEQVKKEKLEKKEIIMKQVYEIRNEYPNISWREVANKVPGCGTHQTAQKYYQIMKEKMSLLENVPKLR